MGYGSDSGRFGGYRGQIPSPGRPTVAWRQDRVRFWAAIAAGAMTEDAAAEAGVSSPVGFRWFRHAGGVNPQLQSLFRVVICLRMSAKISLVACSGCRGA